MSKKDLNCVDGYCEPDHVSDTNNIDSVIEKPRLYYFGDPMCSWCWGIAPALDKLKEAFREEFDFEIVLGGLRPGGGDQWTPEFREMLQTHWEHVQEASGQPFDYSFFERDSFDYDTEPPARAVRVVRDMAPEKEWEFFKSLQESFYARNESIQDVDYLKIVCEKLDIDFSVFEPLFISPKYKQLVNQDFMKSQQFGVRGFPSVILQRRQEHFAVTLGYSDFEKMKLVVNSIMNTGKTTA